jgi:hypothetical protein
VDKKAPKAQNRVEQCFQPVRAEGGTTNHTNYEKARSADSLVRESSPAIRQSHAHKQLIQRCACFVTRQFGQLARVVRSL